MTVYYSKQKAKFGGVTGTIIPYPIAVNDNVNRNFLPAGFLKCDGSILKASVYPALANTIGIGSNCRFAKNPDDIAASRAEFRQDLVACRPSTSGRLAGSTQDGAVVPCRVEVVHHD